VQYKKIPPPTTVAYKWIGIKKLPSEFRKSKKEENDPMPKSTFAKSGVDKSSVENKKYRNSWQKLVHLTCKFTNHLNKTFNKTSDKEISVSVSRCKESRHKEVSQFVKGCIRWTTGLYRQGIFYTEKKLIDEKKKIFVQLLFSQVSVSDLIITDVRMDL